MLPGCGRCRSGLNRCNLMAVGSNIPAGSSASFPVVFSARGAWSARDEDTALLDGSWGTAMRKCKAPIWKPSAGSAAVEERRWRQGERGEASEEREGKRKRPSKGISQINAKSQAAAGGEQETARSQKRKRGHFLPRPPLLPLVPLRGGTFVEFEFLELGLALIRAGAFSTPGFSERSGVNSRFLVQKGNRIKLRESNELQSIGL